jgi:hypothetical protein
MTEKASPGMGSLIVTITVFALIGTPLVAFLWETLNRMMAGWFDPVRIAISIPVGVLLFVLLKLLARQTQRITA